MKKSLLIILSLIFMNMSAHAVGVDCWEEVAMDYYQDPPVSKMKTILGDKVTIIKTKTALRFKVNGVDYYYVIDSPLTASFDKGSTQGALSFRVSGIYGPESYKNSIYYAYMWPVNTAYSYNITSDSLYGSTSGYRVQTSSNSYSTYHVMGGHYIHTFCIVSDHSSSGGGGGAAGASVNYIIKAN